MTLIAFTMFISLILIVANSLDPRVLNRADLFNTFVKLSMGIVLGFVIILMYGVGFPGLKYLFLFIGIGGLAHLLLPYKLPRTFSA